MLRLPVRHRRADEAVRAGPLGPAHRRTGNSLTFTAAFFLQDGRVAERSAASDAGERVVILCLSLSLSPGAPLHI